MRRRITTLAAVSLWLAGCANPPLQTDTARWTGGRLSVRIAATAAQEARSIGAAFELQGDSQRGELRLLSPLGTRVATARWAPGLVVLLTPMGEQRFDSLQALSRQALGEALPLEALPDWLLGRAWAGAAQTPIEGGFEQLGWKVLTRRLDEGWIEATRSAPPEVLLRIKLDDA